MLNKITQHEHEYAHDSTKRERALLSAMLSRAIEDATLDKSTGQDWTGGSSKMIVKRNALSWIMSDLRNGGPGFTFLQVCEELDLDPGRIREAVEKHRGGRISLYQWSHNGPKNRS